MNGDLLFSAALLAVMIFLATIVVADFRRGRVWWLDGPYDRDIHPFSFWTIGAQYVLVLCLGIFLAAALVIHFAGFWSWN